MCGPSTVSAFVSVVKSYDTSDVDSLSFSFPAFALPGVGGWLTASLGFSSQLHTPSLLSAHVRLAINLHTG